MGNYLNNPDGIKPDKKLLKFFRKSTNALFFDFYSKFI